MAAVHADHGIAAYQRRRGAGLLPGSVPDRRCDEAVHAAAALKEEAVVPVGGQAQLEAGAVVLAVRAGTRTVFAFNEAVRPGFLCADRAAGKGCHVVGGDVAVAPFGALNAGVGDGTIFQRGAMCGV